MTVSATRTVDDHRPRAKRRPPQRQRHVAIGPQCQRRGACEDADRCVPAWSSHDRARRHPAVVLPACRAPARRVARDDHSTTRACTTGEDTCGLPGHLATSHRGNTVQVKGVSCAVCPPGVFFPRMRAADCHRGAAPSPASARSGSRRRDVRRARRYGRRRQRANPRRARHGQRVPTGRV